MSRKRKAPRHGRPPKECQICGALEGPWTEEDAYPQWLRKLVLEEVKKLPASALKTDWEPLPRIKLRPVCQTCQRRLNVAFEDPAVDDLKALMRGEALELHDERRKKLAGWLIKTDLALNLVRVGTKFAPTPEAAEATRFTLREMLETGEPPVYATARIAYRGEVVTFGKTVPERMPLPPAPPFLPAGFPPAAYHGVHSIHLMFRLMSETLVGEGVEELEGINDARFTRIWPPGVADPSWPPLFPLGERDLERLRLEWRHHPDAELGNFFDHGLK